MKLNDEILRLRADGSSPEAKGRVVERLQEKNRQTTMKMIGKLSIPAALVAAVAIGGMLSVPRTALASPATVAKAIRDVKNYVINSFTVLDGKRTLNSKTQVVDGKSVRQFFDQNGKLITEGKATQLDGALYELAVGSPIIVDGKAKGAQITVKGHPLGVVPGEKVEVKMTKGKDGKLKKQYFVNGKEVDELPGAVKGKVKEVQGSDLRARSIEIRAGDEEPVYNKVGGFMVVQGDKDGKVSSFASGQTSVDYLLKLLDDPSRWSIDRGVAVNGRVLDRFKLNGPVSPIELYVDPKTSLPAILRFVGPANDGGPIVEDEYVYGAVPPVK